MARKGPFKLSSHHDPASLGGSLHLCISHAAHNLLHVDTQCSLGIAGQRSLHIIAQISPRLVIILHACGPDVVAAYDVLVIHQSAGWVELGTPEGGGHHVGQIAVYFGGAPLARPISI